MAKYRKKPVVIEAEQWWKNGDVDDVVYNYNIDIAKLDEEFSANESNSIDAGNEVTHHTCGCLVSKHGWIFTGYEIGVMVCPGDWIIKDANGKPSRFNHEEFERTHEKVE